MVSEEVLGGTQFHGGCVGDLAGRPKELGPVPDQFRTSSPSASVSSVVHRPVDGS